MCPAALNLTGQRFGRLTAVKLDDARTGRGMRRWICQCDCGNSHTVTIANLTSGSTTSCGCFRNTRDGLTNTHRFWRRYQRMRRRCENPKDKDFKNYGERGVAVCERWKHFPSFVYDMEPSYFDGATLDRRDNNAGYSPENCYWATTKEQNRNQRKSITVDTPWGRMHQAEAAERAGVSREMFKARVSRGWTKEELFNPRNVGPLTKWDRRNAR